MFILHLKEQCTQKQNYIIVYFMSFKTYGFLSSVELRVYLSQGFFVQIMGGKCFSKYEL